MGLFVSGCTVSTALSVAVSPGVPAEDTARRSPQGFGKQCPVSGLPCYCEKQWCQGVDTKLGSFS